MTKPSVEPTDRDLLAEAHDAAYEWVRHAVWMRALFVKFALESWEKENPAPKPSPSADWTRQRDELQTAVFNATTYAIWAVLRRAGYERSQFGAGPLPDLCTPTHLQSRCGQSAHSLRYATSRRLSGVQQAVRHRRNLYLGATRREDNVSTSTYSRTASGDRLVQHTVTTVMDSATAAAAELFQHRLFDGLLKGCLDFGLLESSEGKQAA